VKARGGAVWGALVLLCVEQAHAGGRFRLVPSLTVAEAYDDNVLSSAIDPQSDWVTRADPGLAGEYRSEALTFVGRYSFGAERFRERTELSRVVARQEGGFDLRGDATPRLSLAARGAYFQTHTPSELALPGALDLGRVRTERLETATSMAWKASAKNEVSLEYGFTHDQVAGGIGGEGHVGRLLFDRRATPRDTLRAGYTARRFEWTNGPGLTSHVVAAGWTRDLGPRTRLGVMAGPRLAAGRPVELEAEASLRIAIRGGELAVTGAQTEARVVGIAEPAVVQEGTVTLASEPSRRWRLGLAVGMNRTRFAEGTVRVQRIGFEVGWRIASWLSLEAAPRWTHQVTGPGVGAFRNLDHRVVMLRLVTALPSSRPRTTPLGPRGEEPRPPDAEREGGQEP
jgi:hypothetical protein